MFDVPVSPEFGDVWGPWWFGASRGMNGEMTCTSSFLGGSMGADTIDGWVIWYTEDVYY